MKKFLLILLFLTTSAQATHFPVVVKPVVVPPVVAPPPAPVAVPPPSPAAAPSTQPSGGGGGSGLVSWIAVGVVVTYFGAVIREHWIWCAEDDRKGERKCYRPLRDGMP